MQTIFGRQAPKVPIGSPPRSPAPGVLPAAILQAGIDKGWPHAPGASVVGTVPALSKRPDALPERLSVDLIQGWLHMDAFADRLRRPEANWPLARISDADAGEPGAKAKGAMLSAATATRPKWEHPEPMGLDQLMAQYTSDAASTRASPVRQGLLRSEAGAAIRQSPSRR